MSATAGQQYDIWIQAVAAALKTSGRGFSVRQIDEAEAHAAFIQGVSPVMFARQVSPMPRPKRPGVASKATSYLGSSEVMKPNSGIVRWTCLLLTTVGWIFWYVSTAITGFLLVLLIVLLYGAIREGDTDPIAFGKFTLTHLLGIAVGSIFSFTLGSLWHWLAQHLAIVYHQYEDRHRTLP